MKTLQMVWYDKPTYDGTKSPFLRGSSTIQFLATGVVLCSGTITGYLVLGVQYYSCTRSTATLVDVESTRYCRVRVLVHCTVVENMLQTMMFESDKNTQRRDVPARMWRVIGNPKKALCDKRCQVERSLTIPQTTSHNK
jgi:hypothetical protein